MSKNETILNVGRYEIKVSIIFDDTGNPLEYSQVTGLNYNPLPVNAAWYDEESPFDYTDFAIDNCYHNAYFTVDVRQGWNEPKRYFMLDESIKDLQAEFSKLGYAKHDAWLKAIDSLKHQAKYIQDWFSDEWHFIGITVKVTESFTDESGLIWSRELNHPFDALWGVEWGAYSNDSVINNEQQFKDIVPDLLPDDVTLTDEQLNELWLNLE